MACTTCFDCHSSLHWVRVCLEYLQSSVDPGIGSRWLRCFGLVPQLGGVDFSVAIVFLGLAAAVAGKWLERVGPRCVGVTAALLWGGGFLVGSLGWPRISCG